MKRHVIWSFQSLLGKIIANNGYSLFDGIKFQSLLGKIIVEYFTT